MKRFLLYHGSDKKVEIPEFEYHKNHNDIDNALDFGDAFYCTLYKEEGKEWACKNGHAGILNEYKIDTRYLKHIVDLTNYFNEDSVLMWLAILIHFRFNRLTRTFKESHEKRIKFLLDNYYPKDLIDTADIIISFRADDAYYRFPKEFIEGSISLETLSYSFVNGNLGRQYVIKSKKAYKSIKYVNSYPVEDKYIDSYRKRINDANNNYEKKKIEDENSSNTRRYITDIMKEKNNDKSK